MWSRTINLVLLLILIVMTLKTDATTTTTTTSVSAQSRVGRNFFENTLFQLLRQRRFFMDGFHNGTSVIEKGLSLNDALVLVGGSDDNPETEEGRGRRRKLKQMNRTLIAIVMAYSLKFMFLIPTFMGTLILLKFTTGLAGFFYALFAAVLSLAHHEH